MKPVEIRNGSPESNSEGLALEVVAKNVHHHHCCCSLHNTIRCYFEVETANEESPPLHVSSLKMNDGSIIHSNEN